jgi:hypothetical protein
MQPVDHHRGTHRAGEICGHNLGARHRLERLAPPAHDSHVRPTPEQLIGYGPPDTGSPAADHHHRSSPHEGTLAQGKAAGRRVVQASPAQASR